MNWIIDNWKLVVLVLIVCILLTIAGIFSRYVTSTYAINFNNLVTPIASVLTIVLVFLSFRKQSKSTDILIDQEFDRQVGLYLNSFDNVRKECALYDMDSDTYKVFNAIVSVSSPFNIESLSRLHNPHTVRHDNNNKEDRWLEDLTQIQNVQREYNQRLVSYTNSISLYIIFIEESIGGRDIRQQWQLRNKYYSLLFSRMQRIELEVFKYAFFYNVLSGRVMMLILNGEIFETYKNMGTGYTTIDDAYINQVRVARTLTPGSDNSASI